MLRVVAIRARALLRFDQVDADLRHEMREHVQRLVEANLARGLTLEAAREAARREFGPDLQLMEEARDARGVMWIVTAAQDLRYGIRLMRRAPGFSVAAMLTVA